ncbi:GMC family oxidoreductase N-terminal domain-containing protein, partial [Paenibacillus alkaliterrae]
MNARAVRIAADRGKVAGIEVMTPDRKTFFLKAKTVVVSASTFETPRLLLYSGIPGNAIGHYLTNHSFLRVHGTLIQPNQVAQDGFILIPQTESRPYEFQISELPLLNTLEVGASWSISLQRQVSPGSKGGTHLCFCGLT